MKRNRDTGKSKKKKLSTQDLEEEENLEQELFGALSGEKAGLFSSNMEVESDKLEGPESDDEKGADEAVGNGGAAWADEDDEDAAGVVDLGGRARRRKLRAAPGEGSVAAGVLEARLRGRFRQSNPLTAWAAAGPADQEGGGEEEEDEEAALPAGRLEVARLRDANAQDPAKAVVQTISFHPEGQLMMVGGYDKTLRFFNVDGKDNPKVHAVRLADLPVRRARFCGPGGREAVAAGRRPFFYALDVEAGRLTRIPRIFGRNETSLDNFSVSPDGDLLAFTGKNGYVILVSNKTKQMIGELKMNGKCRGVTFSPDSKSIFATGSDAEVYAWDLRSRRCLARWPDAGGAPAGALAAAAAGGYLAVGAESGVVNIYRQRPGSDMSRKPDHLKAVMNVTTEIDSLCFNRDSQMLAIGSRMVKDSVKLVHLPSCTVFQNWPTARTPLGYASSIEFSPNGGLLAIGNAKGRVLLYRLKHYQNS